MFDGIKAWIFKKLTGTWVQKAIRDGLLVLSTFLLASDASICVETNICDELGKWLGDISPIIVDKSLEILMFLVSLFMKYRAGKAESVGREVLKEKK
jgi:hypothetical protein